MTINSFRDLLVWQKSICLVKTVYNLTSTLPDKERFGICSQVQRAAVSIPSNIAEGCQRNNRAEFRQFCGIAYGSSAELETQLIIIKDVYDKNVVECLELLNEVQRMLRKLIVNLNEPSTTNH